VWQSRDNVLQQFLFQLGGLAIPAGIGFPFRDLQLGSTLRLSQALRCITGVFGHRQVPPMVSTRAHVEASTSIVGDDRAVVQSATLAQARNLRERHT
jgi:hypothetical protein